jgi:hypothetical protein
MRLYIIFIIFAYKILIKICLYNISTDVSSVHDVEMGPNTPAFDVTAGSRAHAAKCFELLGACSQLVRLRCHLLLQIHGVLVQLLLRCYQLRIDGQLHAQVHDRDETLDRCRSSVQLITVMRHDMGKQNTCEDVVYSQIPLRVMPTPSCMRPIVSRPGTYAASNLTSLHNTLWDEIGYHRTVRAII